MKEQSIYQKQWLSLAIILLPAIAINTAVIYYLFADYAGSSLILISNGLLILSLLTLLWVNQSLLKKAESKTASLLLENQPSSKIFPLLSSVIQRQHDALQQDINKIKSLNSELEHRALQDNLTSLQNRSAFRKHLTEFLQQENQSEQACLCLIRSTELTSINHQRGRVAGDQYLQAIAEIVQYVGHRFSTEYVYRLSSSDYAILIKNITLSIAPILGKELKQLFDNFQLQMSMDSAAYTGITFLRPGLAIPS